MRSTARLTDVSIRDETTHDKQDCIDTLRLFHYERPTDNMGHSTWNAQRLQVDPVTLLLLLLGILTSQPTVPWNIAHSVWERPTCDGWVRLDSLHVEIQRVIVGNVLTYHNDVGYQYELIRTPALGRSFNARKLNSPRAHRRRSLLRVRGEPFVCLTP